MHYRPTSGFTIVELIIVIVVIGILTALAVVSFNGIRVRAIDSLIRADLSTAITKINTTKVDSGVDEYPATLSEAGISPSGDDGATTFTYNVSGGQDVYCLQGVNSGRTFYATTDISNPATGYCDGTTGVPSDGNYTEDTGPSPPVVTTETSLASTNGNNQMFSFNVPDGYDYVDFNLTGGTETGFGANLRVRQGAQPTSFTNDCSSLNTGNQEDCYIYNPSADTWYVEVYYNGSDTYSDVTLTVEWGDWPGAFTGNTTIDGDLFDRKVYTYTVPSGVDYVSFQTTGGTEASFGANLQVRYNALPGTPTSTVSSVDCYSNGTDNYENCYMYNPTPGTWYVMVSSGAGSFADTSTYEDVTLSIETGNWAGEYSAPVVLSGSYFYREIYTATIPPGMTTATFTLSGGTETSFGANLAVRYNALPGDAKSNISPVDCYSAGTNNTESCVINSPTAGTWYILVSSGSSAFTNMSTFNNVTLTATWN